MKNLNLTCGNNIISNLLSAAALVGGLFVTADFVSAQSEIAGYRYIERTIYVKEPVTVVKNEEETVYEKKLVTETKHVTQTEQRERRTEVERPVTRTVLKEERTVVTKPVTETKYREKTVEETSYQEVTELRDQEITVRKPVIETEYRDQQFNVRQKITEDLIEVKNETVYKPKTIEETAYIQSESAVLKTVGVADPNYRPRMEWLAAGYYTDPTSGQQVWRRRGLHWVQPTVGMQVAETTPTLVPTTVQRTTLVPEVVQTRRPVELSRYEDRVETRKVPFEVEKMVSETVTRQVPITVKKPIVKSYVERIPYQETSYVEEVVVNKVPVQETVYEKVTKVEPYEVEVSKWVPYTKEIEVPRVVTKRVEYEEIREVPKTIIVKVPVDANGNLLGPGVPLTDDEMKSWSRTTTGYGETPRNFSGKFIGNPQLGEPNRGMTETSGRNTSSVLVEESPEPTLADPNRKMAPVERPEGSGNDSGSEADKAPSINPRDRSTQTMQTERQIAGLEVRQRPGLENETSGRISSDSISGDLPELPSVGRPSVEPNHDRDVLSSERR